jgi:hypothetical protein
MIARLVECVAEVMTCALFVAVGTALMMVGQPLFFAAGLGLVGFSVALLAEERARWHRDQEPQTSWEIRYRGQVYRGRGHIIIHREES